MYVAKATSIKCYTFRHSYNMYIIKDKISAIDHKVFMRNLFYHARQIHINQMKPLNIYNDEKVLILNNVGESIYWYILVYTTY